MPSAEGLETVAAQPPRPTKATAQVVVCVDFGSTFTKAAVVDLAAGRVSAAASHRTTIDTDVLEGYAACRAALVAQDPRAADAEVLACSSAGGGLRIAVVGNEELVTAEAGRRVALSSGGKVVAVLAAGSRPAEPAEPDGGWLGDLEVSRPDVVLLTGGTDGGNAEVILACARDLVQAGWHGPVVVAGNTDAGPEVGAVLEAGGVPHVLAANVVPRIGVLAPDPARHAIREVFLAHVIGGKHLSASAEFIEMVRGATPDVVLTAVELLGRGLDEEQPGVGDVVVVDVGGATTDVHSVVEVDPEDSELSREVVASTAVTRTVEGDLGMRWSAGATVEEAYAAGLLEPGTEGELRAAAARRQDDPGLLPDDLAETAHDETIARLAVGLALRRHAGRSRVVVGPAGRVLERSGRDLREVDLLVGSGGALRNGGAGAATRILAASTGAAKDSDWQLPRHPRVVIDRDYVLAAAGLLADRNPRTAHRLLTTLTGSVDDVACAREQRR